MYRRNNYCLNEISQFEWCQVLIFNSVALLLGLIIGLIIRLCIEGLVSVWCSLIMNSNLCVVFVT